VATARERTAAAQEVIERIPHPGVQYAYLELRAGNVNEFEKLRDDVLASDSLAHYRAAMAGSGGEAKAAVKKTPTLTAAQKAKLTGEKSEARPVVDGDSGEGQGAAGSDGGASASDAAEPVSPPAPSAAPAAASNEGLSPREIARQKLLAKKGA
jgi:hypothetical protein